MRHFDKRHERIKQILTKRGDVHSKNNFPADFRSIYKIKKKIQKIISKPMRINNDAQTQKAFAKNINNRSFLSLEKTFCSRHKHLGNNAKSSKGKPVMMLHVGEFRKWRIFRSISKYNSPGLSHRQCSCSMKDLDTFQCLFFFSYSSFYFGLSLVANEHK